MGEYFRYKVSFNQHKNYYYLTESPTDTGKTKQLLYDVLRQKYTVMKLHTRKSNIVIKV